MKRRASERLENQIQKKQKVSHTRYWEVRRESDYSSSSEELSSELSDAEQISQVLKPQEVGLLREDPWNRNFYYASWTNEYTIIVDPTDSDRRCRPVYSTATSTTLPNDFFWPILLNSDLQDLVRWRQVSKYFDTLLSASPKLWQSAFYGQRWRLPHEIRNFNERHDPTYSEIVINEKKVDWFSECKRNFLNATRIKHLVEEISKKLTEAIKPYSKRRKPGGKVKRARMFNPGLTDDELDAWEELHEFKLTNDFRELYKAMNGARFKFLPTIDEMGEVWDHECARAPPVCLPKLDTVRVRSVTWSNFVGEESTALSDLTQLAPSSFKKPASVVVPYLQQELDSDGSSYSPSEQEDSDSGQTLSTDAKTALFKVLHMGEYIVREEETVMIYEPVLGALMPVDPEIYPQTLALPIVEYLQQVYDMIDGDIRVPLFFTFTDYIVNAKEIRKKFEYPNEQSPFEGELKFWLAECNDAFLWLHDCNDYIPARAIRLIKAAAEDFVVKVFAKAQAMETSDALQADTFISAAKELGQQYFPDPLFPFEKAADPTSRTYDLLRYWVEIDENTKENKMFYKPLNTSTIDL